MAYTWIADPGTIMEPLTRNERPWAEAWAERLARGVPSAMPVPLHKHDAGCLYGEILTQPAFGVYPALSFRACRVLGEGKHPGDTRFMAYLGMADGGR